MYIVFVQETYFDLNLGRYRFDKGKPPARNCAYSVMIGFSYVYNLIYNCVHQSLARIDRVYVGHSSTMGWLKNGNDSEKLGLF
jgi:hypothetical protein